MKVMRARSEEMEEKAAPAQRKSEMGAKRDWMAVDPNAQKALLNAARLRQNRAPEFWLRPGDSRTIRFRGKGAIAIFEQYTGQIRGENVAFTCPRPGDTDLLAQTKLKRRVVSIYELVDIEGYINKQQKHLKNIPRLWKVGIKTQAIIEAIIAKRGPLFNYECEVSRTGSGTDTVYAIVPLGDSVIPPQIKALPRFTNEEIRKFYMPPTVDEQRTIIAQMGVTVDEEGADYEE